MYKRRRSSTDVNIHQHNSQLLLNNNKSNKSNNKDSTSYYSHFKSSNPGLKY